MSKSTKSNVKQLTNEEAIAGYLQAIIQIALPRSGKAPDDFDWGRDKIVHDFRWCLERNLPWLTEKMQEANEELEMAKFVEQAVQEKLRSDPDATMVYDSKTEWKERRAVEKEAYVHAWTMLVDGCAIAQEDRE